MELAPHLALLAEPLRVRLLAVLATHELGVSELCRIVQLPQSTVSRHLKDLRVAAWVKRRAEGTMGLVRLDLSELSPEVVSLWDIVYAAHRSTALFEEDAQRLSAVLDARTSDGRSFFGRVHREWDALRQQLFGDQFLLPTLLSLLPEGLVLADLGCGTGEALLTLAPLAKRVIGVDREPAMLDIAAERTADCPNVELRQGGLEQLPLRDGEVDAALCMLVLHHVEPLERAIAELARICKPRGRIVILDMVAHDRQDWRQAMGHVHLGFSDERLAALAAEAGLVVKHRRTLTPAPDAQGPPLFVAVLARA